MIHSVLAALFLVNAILEFFCDIKNTNVTIHVAWVFLLRFWN